MRAAVLAALIAAAAPVQASERCFDMAGMYHLAYSLRDSGMSERDLMAITVQPFPAFTAGERQRAIERTRNSGDLGFMSINTMFRHVYLECKKIT